MNKVLSVNAGSSSLKIALYNMPNAQLLASFIFFKIGVDDCYYKFIINKKSITKDIFIKNYEEAVKIFLKEIINYKLIINLDEIKGIGHRVVHGKDKYVKPFIIDDKVIKDIDSFKSLAPLHNPLNLLGIRTFQKILPNTLSIAVFDTAFSQTMNKEFYIYPVPYEWYDQYSVRKYGFHGISHKYITNRIQKLYLDSSLKIISCHLGSGSSIFAIKNGVVIDTSIGFTPISGLPMISRCGDIDVSIIPYIKKQTNKSLEEIMDDLNKRSGLLGITNTSIDFKEIEKGYLSGAERSILGVNIYVNSIIKYIAYYNILLEHADVIVFTGGIGENSIMLRELIISKLKPLGVIIDRKRNKIGSKEELISSLESKIKCYVISTNEELMIAEEVFNFLT